MWNLISNTASILTCILFVFYLIGRLWSAIISCKTRYEKFQIIPHHSPKILQGFDHEVMIDTIGSIVEITSLTEIKKISFYRVSCSVNDCGSLETQEKALVASYNNLHLHDKLYVTIDLGCIFPSTYIEIERQDYTKASFILGNSGKTENSIVHNYQYHLTLKGILYYLLK